LNGLVKLTYLLSTHAQKTVRWLRFWAVRGKAADVPQCEHCKRLATRQRADQSRRRPPFFVLGYLALSLSVAVLAEDPPAQDLEDLRQKIGELQQELQANEANRHEAADALRESEKAISEANRELAKLAREQQLTASELSNANNDILRIRNQLNQRREQIRKLMLARYRNGQHEALRLLLNKQDPNELTRSFHYYRYIASAQQKLSLALAEQLEKLNASMELLQQKNQALTQLAAEKVKQRALLQASQSSRQHVLSQISAKIGQQQREIGKLQQDEQRLSTLVEKLDRMIREREAREARDRDKQAKEAAKLAARKAHENIKGNPSKNPAKPVTGKGQGIVNESVKVELTPAAEALAEHAETGGTSFKDLKGHLHLPMRGEVLGHFGTARREGTFWKGVFIKGSAGQPVKAVAGGRVVFADWLRGFGNMLIVDHGDGFLTLYGAAESLVKQVGDIVKPGDDLATSGNSGGSSETGIYFELRHLGKPVDPLAWVK